MRGDRRRFLTILMMGISRFKFKASLNELFISSLLNCWKTWILPAIQAVPIILILSFVFSGNEVVIQV